MNSWYRCEGFTIARTPTGALALHELAVAVAPVLEEGRTQFLFPPGLLMPRPSAKRWRSTSPTWGIYEFGQFQAVLTFGKFARMLNRANTREYW